MGAQAYSLGGERIVRLCKILERFHKEQSYGQNQSRDWLPGNPLFLVALFAAIHKDEACKFQAAKSIAQLGFGVRGSRKTGVSVIPYDFIENYGRWISPSPVQMHR